MFPSVLLWSVAMSPGSMTPRDSAAPTTRAASYHVTTDGFIMNISSGFMPPPHPSRDVGALARGGSAATLSAPSTIHSFSTTPIDSSFFSSFYCRKYDRARSCPSRLICLSTCNIFSSRSVRKKKNKREKNPVPPAENLNFRRRLDLSMIWQRGIRLRPPLRQLFASAHCASGAPRVRL
jgi:hypothetical protein